ncbi:MAG: hypothetical protein HDT14_01280 [Oscillibacter sp.]|nr:hypothetical protein [Oscillibacter sp.]
MANKQPRRKRAAQEQPAAPAQSATPPAAPPRSSPASSPAPSLKKDWPIPVLMILLFFFICLTSSSTIKYIAMIVLLAAIATILIRFSTLRDRMTLPFAAVTLWVLMSGISTFYAVSGRFALSEFLKLLIAYCLFLMFIAFAGKGAGTGRAIASILEACAALAGLISIDLLSTHLLSTPFLDFMGLFSSDYADLAGVDAGVRMTSIFVNPNGFAGFVGIGVLLSLGLANSAQRPAERRFHQVCLLINALSFVLAFSMGASGMICLAFLAFLLLESRERRTSLFILMVETLLLTLLAAIPISLTGLEMWSGFQPVPLLCTAAGALLLCVLDQLVGQRVSAALTGHGKAAAVLLCAFAAALGVFAALAVNVTGGVSLEAGGSLRRADYPSPGSYTLEVESTGDLQVMIESQNQQETMMHTGTVVYSGPVSGAAFTVPEDSLVVYFNFRAQTESRLESAVYRGSAGEGSLKLHYKLLPGFIATRLQGLFANENAIQRTVFFSDGLKLFLRSPVFGLGMGAFENAICSVQSFYYETKYAHNHYIQALVETGVVGLLLFLAVLGLSAAAVLKRCRKQDASPLTAALGAALVFMAGHASVEIVFSARYYLPMALGIFALISLCCGDALPLLPGYKSVRTWTISAIAALLAVFTILLGLNMRARGLVDNISRSADPFADLQSAAAMDRFEWAGHMLSYVVSYQYGMGTFADEYPIQQQAEEYAQRLAQVDSNSIPIHLAEYYFVTDRPAQAFAMIEKYVSYVSSNPDTWKVSFQLLRAYAQDTPEFRESAAHIYQMLSDWNEQNMGTVSLDEQTMAFIQGILPQ